MTTDLTTDLEAGKKPEEKDTEKVEEEIAEKAKAEVETEKVEEEAEFDKDRAMATIKSLRGIEKQAKKDKLELERLKKQDDDRKTAALSETDRLKAEIAKLSGTIKELTTKQMQREAADKVKLPMIFADRIKGETPEEMEADAKALLEAMPKGKAALDIGVTSPGENAITGETEAQKRKRLIG